MNAGLVGCGEIASRYARILRSEERLGLDLLAVTDLDTPSANRFASEYALHVAPSLDALLNMPLDLVCVCTPNATHAPIAMRALAEGRNVLVEHPMAMSSADADRLIDTAASTGRRLFVVRQRRFSRAVQTIRAALSRQLLRGIESADLRLHWSRRPAYFEEKPWRRSTENGGVVVNQASHFLDLLLYLFGDPEEVAGVMGNVRHDIPCEDTALGTIKFANGVRVSFECTTAAPDGSNTTSLTIRAGRDSVVLCGRDLDRVDEPLPAALNGIGETLEGPLSGDHRGYLNRVARSLGGESVEVVDGREGARAVRLIERIYATFARGDAALRAHFATAFGETVA